MIVITGANGFIGSALVWQLNQLDKNDIVCVDSIHPSQRPELLGKRRIIEFLGHDEIWDFLEGIDPKKISWIIHIGANSSTTETNWEHLYENNTLYSVKLFEWCAENAVNFVYASSAATYGAGEKGYSDRADSQALTPLNLYGKSKLLFDQWALSQEECPPNWYGLKFFNVFGPNEYHKKDMASLVYKSFHKIKETGKIQLFRSHRPDFNDGEQKRDFIYIKEVTAWIVELMQELPSSGIYNMGYGEARSWNDLARAVFVALDKEPEIEYIDMPANIKEQYQYFTQADMSKWKSEGLSAPQWKLEKAVDDYIKNYLNCEDPYL